MNFSGQGPSNQGQGIAQGIGDKISSGLNSLGSGLSSGLSSVTGAGQGQQAPSMFNSFYTIVVAIAVVILILVLAFLGWTMSKQKETDTFPKLQTTCPDFWGIADGKCTRPVANQVNYGNKDDVTPGLPGGVFVNNQFDFTNAGWSAGGNAVCAKKKWANSHGINWDTVTNANYC